MSGVLRRGSLNFDFHPSLKGNRAKDKNVGVSVISIDYRNYSSDVKQPPPYEVNIVNDEQEDLSKDVDSDIISNNIGHFGLWQFIWTFLLSLFQVPTTFHIFAFVFQVSTRSVRLYFWH